MAQWPCPLEGVCWPGQQVVVLQNLLVGGGSFTLPPPVASGKCSGHHRQPMCPQLGLGLDMVRDTLPSWNTPFSSPNPHGEQRPHPPNPPDPEQAATGAPLDFLTSTG